MEIVNQNKTTTEIKKNDIKINNVFYEKCLHDFYSNLTQVTYEITINELKQMYIYVLCIITVLEKKVNEYIKTYYSTHYVYNDYINDLFNNDINDDPKKLYDYVYLKKFKEIMSKIVNLLEQLKIGIHRDIDINICVNIKKSTISEHIKNDKIFIMDKYENTQFMSEYKDIAMEIKNNILYSTKKIRFDNIKIMYEFLFGNFMRNTQYDLINDILKTNNSNKQFFHLLMGEGKSSVVLPALCLYLSHHNIFVVTPETLISQTCDTLINTIGNFRVVQKINKEYDVFKYNNTYGEKNVINVISGNMLKKLILIFSLDSECKYSSSIFNDDDDQFGEFNDSDKYKFFFSILKRSYFIYDEVDDIIDPIKAELNIPNGLNKTINNSNILFEIIYDCIYAIYYDPNNQNIRNKYIKSSQASIYPHFHILSDDAITLLKVDKEFNNIIFNVIQNKKYNLFKDYQEFTSFLAGNFENLKINNINVAKCIYKFLNNTLWTVLKKIYKRHYGLTDKKIFAIPYTAVNTPSTNSEFSDYYFTAAYTILSYSNSELRIQDIKSYLTYLQNKLIINMISNTKYNEKLSKLFDGIEFNTNLLIIENIEVQIGDKINIMTKNQYFIKKYLKWIITKKLTTVDQQYNCSMFDVLSSKISVFRTGFTGTPFIPNIIDIDDSNAIAKVIPREADYGSVLASIIGISKVPLFLKINGQNILNELVKLIETKKYDSLIDVGSILIDTSSHEVAKYIIQNIKSIENVVYIDNYGQKKYIGKNLDSLSFNNGLNKNTMFVYFDQKNITGIDVKQKKTAKALVTTRSNLRFRDMAQGIFRMRDIQNGQSIDFVSLDDYINSSEILISVLINNEKNVNDMQNQIGAIQNANKTK